MLDRLLQAAVVAAWWRWIMFDSPIPVFTARVPALTEYHRQAFSEGVEYQRAVQGGKMMGVDCYVYLPPQTHHEDVQTVIGLALGMEARAVYREAVTVEGATVRVSESTPSMLVLEFGQHSSFFYHMETSTGERLVSSRARPSRLAIAKRLVDTFGGRADFDDCDDEDSDYARPAPHSKRPDDGDEWSAWHSRLATTKPLTEAEIASMEPLAAYREDGGWR